MLNNKRNPAGSKSKFELYCQLKKQYKMEDYLAGIQDNSLRKHIAGIRCANNRISINFLRKFGVKRENRFCNLCNISEIGNELHTLFECKNSHLVKFRDIFSKKTSISITTNSISQ